MDLFNTFAVDPKRLQEGVWHVFDQASDEVVDESAIGDRVAVKIASTDNPSYRQELYRKLRQAQTKKLSAAEDARLTGELMADYIILDWRNWVIQGQPVAYSREMVIRIWSDPTWIHLKGRLNDIAGQDDAFKAVREEEIVKN